MNHGCSMLVWFGTRSRITCRPLSCAAQDHLFRVGRRAELGVDARVVDDVVAPVVVGRRGDGAAPEPLHSEPVPEMVEVCGDAGNVADTVAVRVRVGCADTPGTARRCATKNADPSAIRGTLVVETATRSSLAAHRRRARSSSRAALVSFPVGAAALGPVRACDPVDARVGGEVQRRCRALLRGYEEEAHNRDHGLRRIPEIRPHAAGMECVRGDPSAIETPARARGSRGCSSTWFPRTGQTRARRSSSACRVLKVDCLRHLVAFDDTFTTRAGALDSSSGRSSLVRRNGPRWLMASISS